MGTGSCGQLAGVGRLAGVGTGLCPVQAERSSASLRKGAGFVRVV